MEESNKDKNINEDILLDMQMELRHYLFVRPSNLNIIEDKAISLCDGVVKMFEDKEFIVSELQSQILILKTRNNELEEAFNKIKYDFSCVEQCWDISEKMLKPIK